MIFSLFKDKKISKEEDENWRKNAQKIISYWRGIVGGETNLENGEKFDMYAFYNPKHLKYSVEEIKKSLTYVAAFLAKDSKKLYDSCHNGYMLLASFERKGVKDKIDTGVGRAGRFAAEEFYSKGFKMPEKIDLKEGAKMAEKFLSLSKEEVKGASEDLLKMQVKLSNEFNDFIANIKKK